MNEELTQYLAQCDEAVGTLALDLMGVRHDSSLSYARVLDKSWLDLGSAEQVARYVDHIIDTTGHPYVAVLQE